MLTFLKIFLAFVLALIVVVVVGYWFIRWKLRSLFKSIVDSIGSSLNSGIPPFRVTLRRLDEISSGLEGDEFFHNKKDVDKSLQKLNDLGFEELTRFWVEELTMPMVLLVHRDRRSHALIYDLPNPGVWCEVVRCFKDGTRRSYTNLKDHGMDKWQPSRTEFLPELTLEELARRLWQDTPDDNLEVHDAESFRDLFQNDYAAEMNWRIARGGPTREEIERVNSLTSDEPATEEAIEQVQTQWRLAIGEFLSQQAIKQYRLEANLDKATWRAQQDRLAAVHDRTLPQQAVGLISGDFFDPAYVQQIIDEAETQDEPDDALELAQMRTELDQYNQLRQRMGAVSVREAFRELVDQQPAEERLECLTTVMLQVDSATIQADVWLKPDWGDDEDYDD